jgi:hypothetical protein
METKKALDLVNKVMKHGETLWVKNKTYKGKKILLK